MTAGGAAQQAIYYEIVTKYTHWTDIGRICERQDEPSVQISTQTRF